MAAPLVVAWIAWWWLSFVPATPTAYFEGAGPGGPVRVIAHQGGDGLMPGNTLMALAHAHDLGADVLEFDVHATADGELVAIHDATVDRTTDGTGAIAAMSFAESQGLDAAHDWPGGTLRPPYRGAGIHIPAVRAILAAFPSSSRFNLELKVDADAPAITLCRLLREGAAGGRVLVASMHDRTMAAFRAACPEVATSATASEVRRFLVLTRLGLRGLYRSRALALQVPRRAGGIQVLDADFVADAHALGLHVDVWTVNTREELRAMIALGVDGVITDRPDLALAVRASTR
jgi:glycerophosphoryl diester phosphodiesterase